MEFEKMNNYILNFQTEYLRQNNFLDEFNSNENYQIFLVLKYYSEIAETLKN